MSMPSQRYASGEAEAPPCTQVPVSGRQPPRLERRVRLPLRVALDDALVHAPRARPTTSRPCTSERPGRCGLEVVRLRSAARGRRVDAREALVFVLNSAERGRPSVERGRGRGRARRPRRPPHHEARAEEGASGGRAAGPCSLLPDEGLALAWGHEGPLLLGVHRDRGFGSCPLRDASPDEAGPFGALFGLPMRFYVRDFGLALPDLDRIPG